MAKKHPKVFVQFAVQECTKSVQSLKSGTVNKFSPNIQNPDKTGFCILVSVKDLLIN
ncbi:MAG: hypothetical protein US86_C0001G0314 [Candidatus Daviesbacteria bacterium GW2011_GWA2_38_24]|uniref:Uncharacterized protein n=1 Tax=Candidatus Daviesbacteria bacterium GW2011_GWA2_38_24 TaxID=1618422 RepID=A0A0G0JKJ1_9BACT|nr:MAG: hypothetical protein US86_C0001G0314 [Candidatus Daviesbacteria bacterium GW2011_GWA2_38_24]KKQ79935.1 MAG: hypothetical protein UT01_C0024G0016 [Candidatus Daviesbacteria bacterium GW2011_GWA1_38_7]